MAIELPPPPRLSMRGLQPAPAPVFVPAPVEPPELPLFEIYDLESEPELDMNGYKALCQKAATRGLRRIVRIIDDDEQPAAAHIAAAKELNNRAYGQPKQAVELTIPDELADLTDAELEHFVKTRGERPKR